MASLSNSNGLTANLHHIYFFIDRASDATECKSQTKHKSASSTSNGSTKGRSRTSSPGSSHTEATAETTATTSSSEMNPLAPAFSPRFAHSDTAPLPPPPSASQLFELRKTATKGLALFATAPIPRGTLIICEQPLIRVTGESLHSVWGPYCRLSNAQKAAFDSLHGYQAKNLDFEQASRRSLIDPNDDSLDDEDIEELVADHVRVMSIFSVNNFRIPPFDLGVFATASRLNHSCVPNVHHSFNPSLKSTTIYAVKDVQPGEELCATYLGGEAHYFVRSQRIEILRSRYGFTCDCAACTDRTGASDGRRETMASIAWGLDQFQRGTKQVGTYVPANDLAALNQVEDLVTLMLTEGIQTVELTKAYRTASRQALRLNNYDLALEYARNEAEVERNCMGTEISDLKKKGFATECWFAEIFEAINLEKGHNAVQQFGGAVMSPAVAKKAKQNNKKKQKAMQADGVNKSNEAKGTSGWTRGEATKDTSGWTKGKMTNVSFTGGWAKEEANEAECTNGFAEEEVIKGIKW